MQYKKLAKKKHEEHKWCRQAQRRGAVVDLIVS
jgi:hypothetical protein